jgi:uncharacterized damage-inducible protein DinB
VGADAEFVSFSAEKLKQLGGRIEDCLGRLNYEQVWLRTSGNENAVGNLVLHLCGNVTQWIGTGVAGRPDQRERDKEFAARGEVQPAELAARIRAVVDDSAGVIRSLTPERLAARTSVQGFNLTILEAVYHVVEHFSMHTGQILFATKLLTGADLGYYHDLAALARTETVP